jgi:hypothetical protein
VDGATAPRFIGRLQAECTVRPMVRSDVHKSTAGRLAADARIDTVPGAETVLCAAAATRSRAFVSTREEKDIARLEAEVEDGLAPARIRFFNSLFPSS